MENYSTLAGLTLVLLNHFLDIRNLAKFCHFIFLIVKYFYTRKTNKNSQKVFPNFFVKKIMEFFSSFFFLKKKKH